MAYGPMKVFSGAIASGAATGAVVTLDKSYSKVFVQVPSMSTAATLSVWGSTDGTVFNPVLERVNTAPVQFQATDVTTGVVTGGVILPMDIGFPYVQFRTGAVVSGGVAIKVICSD